MGQENEEPDEDEEFYDRLAKSEKFLALLRKSRESLAAGKGISEAEFWRRVNERQSELPERKE